MNPQVDNCQASRSARSNPPPDMAREALPVRIDPFNTTFSGNFHREAARVALLGEINDRSSGLVEGERLHSTVGLIKAIARVASIRQSIMAGEYDDILPGTNRHALFFKASPRERGEIESQLLSGIVKETKILCEASRFLDIEKLVPLLKKALTCQDDFDRSQPINLAASAIANTFSIGLEYRDFATLVSGNHRNILNRITPLPNPLTDSIRKFFQVLIIGHGALNDNLGFAFLSAACLQYLKIREHSAMTPNRDLREAYANESYAQMLVEAGINLPLMQVLQRADSQQTARASLILRAMRLFGERPEYIDNVVVNSHYSLRHKSYPKLEEEFVATRKECESLDDLQFYKVLTALHAVQLVNGFEDKIKSIRMLNTLTEKQQFVAT